ncbi:hypothetical protein SPRG_00472 [Saprolegnia parasitica CBS 223.65]|uniref:Nudix hydrolase domain-containing protein n=1 Tax=Saprolegnia parasitica (strain CBS 223.65) TaxID=695850 RepID=A0A067CYR3_SAPPC|nr:hypothetical protein SPRG_00472 [Saprolegnia parasitica CBS 223.65]KDO35628.1 hypothetical protein SPRG_00472 [Saprolegnia parasitica CBS 223.65]|eukprot:XP_012193956.1 hypothetical protein SPRG_00472 [Saprolegnia parasitica CBS 223.65]
MVQLVDAATVVCLRPSTTADASNKWDVLLAQSEVKNWLRSTPTTTVLMRYPGEWKFPGGQKDMSDESLRATALRELREELLGIQVPETARLHWVSTKETRIVKGRRYRMHNFAALATENAWLQLDTLVNEINANLAAKRDAFALALATGDFWAMETEAKHGLSPEVRSIAWFRMDAAIALLSGDTPFVNAFQETEFATYSITARDPMYQSMMTLMDLASLDAADFALRAKV